MAEEILVTHLTIDGRDVPVLARRHPRAQRLILRLDPAGAAVRVTLPVGVPIDEARRMVERKAGWILTRWRGRGQTRPFADGASIPLFGETHVVRHRPELRAGVRAQGGEILVSGMAEHLPRRLADWLRRQARDHIGQRVHHHALALNLKPGRITLRDTRSRWGSCSAAGNLSFCWRLVLAPEPVIDYVAAHEVAHLAEMNHSPRFWALVERRIPQWKQRRDWLNRHGRELFLYG